MRMLGAGDDQLHGVEEHAVLLLRGSGAPEAEFFVSGDRVVGRVDGEISRTPRRQRLVPRPCPKACGQAGALIGLAYEEVVQMIAGPDGGDAGEGLTVFRDIETEVAGEAGAHRVRRMLGQEMSAALRIELGD